MRHLRSFLFIFSFFYILFFSQCIPFFFDDHEFNRSYIQTSYVELFKQLVSLSSGGISGGPQQVYGIFFRFLFPFFGFEYCSYRIAKALIFSSLVVLLFTLADVFFRNWKVSLTYTLIITVNFPFYIHTLVYDGPHIIAEFFKVMAILFFLKDIREEKTSLKRQGLIFLCALLAIRTYMPAYSIAMILPLTTLFFHPRLLRRYLFLFFFIILIQFPIGLDLSNLNTKSSSEYAPHFVNMRHAFLNDFWHVISNPFPNHHDLYYKSIPNILTFFGFWLLVIAGTTLIVIKVIRNSKDMNKKYNPFENDKWHLLIALTLGWILSELPTYVFLPEHAIRYSFTFFVPFTLLSTALVVRFSYTISEKYQKVIIAVILLFVIGIIVTNVFYTYSFRAGWGSSFIGFEKVMDFFAALQRNGTISVVYQAGSVAEEYKYVNKTSKEYSFSRGIEYKKTAGLNEFRKENLENISQQYSQVFVLKRITSVSKTAYPPLPLEESSLFDLITTIEGIDERTWFDWFNIKVMNVLNISYTPNKINVYEYISFK